MMWERKERTLCLEGELNCSAISDTSLESPSASFPSTTSLINEIVLSKLLLLVEGLVLVVPRLCFLPCPGLQGLSGPRGELGDPGDPTGEPVGGVLVPLEPGDDGVASMAVTVVGPKMSRLKTGGDWGISEKGELGCECEGEAGASSSA